MTFRNVYPGVAKGGLMLAEMNVVRYYNDSVGIRVYLIVYIINTLK
jgi:hypothetical protein